MKTILVLSILLCTIAMPALAELIDADLNKKNRLIVNEEVTKELAPIKTDIAQLDERLRNVEIAVGPLTGRIDGVEKQVSHTTADRKPLTNIVFGKARTHTPSRRTETGITQLAAPSSRCAIVPSNQKATCLISVYLIHSTNPCF